MFPWAGILSTLKIARRFPKHLRMDPDYVPLSRVGRELSFPSLTPCPCSREQWWLAPSCFYIWELLGSKKRCTFLSEKEEKCLMLRYTSYQSYHITKWVYCSRRTKHEVFCSKGISSWAPAEQKDKAHLYWIISVKNKASDDYENSFKVN